MTLKILSEPSLFPIRTLPALRRLRRLGQLERFSSHDLDTLKAKVDLVALRSQFYAFGSLVWDANLSACWTNGRTLSEPLRYF